MREGEAVEVSIQDHQIVGAKLTHHLLTFRQQNIQMSLPDTMSMPKKRFPWNDLFRNLLYDITVACRQKYLILKPRNQTVDQFQDEYMKTHIQSLWPSAWIKFEDFKKQLDKRKRHLSKGQGTPISKPSTSSAALSNNTNSTKNTGSKAPLTSVKSESTSKKSSEPAKVDSQKPSSALKEHLLNGGGDGHHSKTDTNDIRAKISSFGTDLTIIPIPNDDPAKGGGVDDLKQQKTKKDSSKSSKSESSNHKSGGSKKTDGDLEAGHQKTDTSKSSLDSSILAPPKATIVSVKRSSDHSINSIISGAVVGHEPDPKSSKSDHHHHHSSKSKTSSPDKVQIIDLEEMIDKKSYLPNIPKEVIKSVNGEGESRSVPSMKVRTDLMTANLPKSEKINHVSLDSDSDDLEIVGVFPILNKQPGPKSKTLKTIQTSNSPTYHHKKDKHKHHSSGGGSSSANNHQSSSSSSHNSHHNSNQQHRSEKAWKSDASTGEVLNLHKDTDLDVNQIMKDLKDLQVSGIEKEFTEEVVAFGG
jgi:Ubinuclein conserved middle domain